MKETAEMVNLSDRRKRWGVILAGGDGGRLRPLTRLISRDDRPKQFCHLYGGMTLLEQARRRAQRNIPAEQILVSLRRAHEDFYLRALVDCPSQRVVQPQNRGTAVAILSSLLCIASKDPHATVAIFPSDHYYSDENVIAEAMEKAFDVSAREPDSLTLIGAKPSGPEEEYGWIETGTPVWDRPSSFRVRGFCEKPVSSLAQYLFARGALWNTFVMAGKALAFLEAICSAVPGLFGTFRQFPRLRATNEELRFSDSLFARVPFIDFSRQVLSLEPQRLIVQQLGPVIWSDLGDCNRAVAALSRSAIEPEWVQRWRATNLPAVPRIANPLAAIA